MPTPVFIALVVLQTVFAIALILLAVRLVRVIRSQYGTVIPPDIAKSFRRLFGRKSN